MYELYTPKIRDDVLDEVFEEQQKKSIPYINLSTQKLYQNFEYELTAGEEEKEEVNNDAETPTEQDHEALIEQELKK